MGITNKEIIMTLSLYSTYRAWKWGKAVRASFMCPVTFPAARKSSSVMRALALLGLGLGGMSAGDDEHIHGVG
jgi:hypothetical protein